MKVIIPAAGLLEHDFLLCFLYVTSFLKKSGFFSNLLFSVCTHFYLPGMFGFQGLNICSGFHSTTYFVWFP